jgi:hypothetical protein
MSEVLFQLCAESIILASVKLAAYSARDIRGLKTMLHAQCAGTCRLSPYKLPMSLSISYRHPTKARRKYSNGHIFTF